MYAVCFRYPVFQLYFCLDLLPSALSCCCRCSISSPALLYHFHFAFLQTSSSIGAPSAPPIAPPLSRAEFLRVGSSLFII
uniref:Putative secreted protein n=1 Tax=Anopheles triannulatus TaxID=58253 RepID=A0A2M4B863_9DIPT